MKKSTAALPLIACGILAGSCVLASCSGGNKTDAVTATISDLTIGVGQTQTISPLYSDASKASPNWTFTGGGDYATFSGMTVTGVSIGTAAINGKDENGIKSDFSVTVRAISVTAENQTMSETDTLSLAGVITAEYAPDAYNVFDWQYAFSVEDGEASDYVTFDEDAKTLTAVGTKYGAVTVTATNEHAPTQTFTVTVTKANYINLFNEVGTFEGSEIGFTTGGDLAACFALTSENHYGGSKGLNFWSDEDAAKKGTISYTLKHLDTTKVYSFGFYAYNQADVYATMNTGEQWFTAEYKYKDGNWSRYTASFTPTTETAVFTLTVECTSWTDEDTTTWNKWAAVDDISVQEGDMLDVIAKQDCSLISEEGSVESLSYTDIITAVGSGDTAVTIEAQSGNADILTVDNTAQTITPVTGKEGVVEVTFTVTMGEVVKTVKANVTVVATVTELTTVEKINAAGTFTVANDKWSVKDNGFSGAIGHEWIKLDATANGGYSYNGNDNDAVQKNILYITDLTLEAATAYTISIKAQGTGNLTLAFYDSSVAMTEEGIEAATALATETKAVATTEGWTNPDTVTMTYTPDAEKTVTLVIIIDSTNWLCVDDLTAAI